MTTSNIFGALFATASIACLIAAWIRCPTYIAKLQHPLLFIGLALLLAAKLTEVVRSDSGFQLFNDVLMLFGIPTLMVAAYCRLYVDSKKARESELRGTRIV
jgi:predicted ABC-type sugar transport system permease subunit